VGSILITGAGSGFGREIALRLARDGFDVIAGVEVYAQLSELNKTASAQGLTIQVEKLDVTNPIDRENAWGWDVDTLLNNAAVPEGGALIDIPEMNLRRQFEVNVIGPLLLTQGFLRKMIAKGGGSVIFMSSIAGFLAVPYTGAYAGAKHAIEAFADVLHQEMADFGIRVATINPGPHSTGFNELMFETWKTWNPEARARSVFDYSKLSFPLDQYDPQSVVEPAVGVLTGAIDAYRTVLPPEASADIRQQMDKMWERRQNHVPGLPMHPDGVYHAKAGKASSGATKGSPR
jgi:NAD(P)-dependent dehydrogenase (short-subunit alcohol dehydrogenase family)